jgi:hypothetical protein
MKQLDSAGLSDRIRKIAQGKHVRPAMGAGKREFSISVRDLMEEAEAEGISTKQRVPAFCTSIQKDSFLRENNLEIVSVDGPVSKLSTTVVVHYRVAAKRHAEQTKDTRLPICETPAEKAFRLTEKLRGLLKDELAEYGGGEAFLQWVRSEDEDAA